MRHSIAVIAFAMLLTFAPATTLGLPTTPEPTPQNGCVFADAVLKEIAAEEARIYVEVQTVSMARKVVLTLQVKSGENLRKATHTWKSQHCL